MIMRFNTLLLLSMFTLGSLSLPLPLLAAAGAACDDDTPCTGEGYTCIEGQCRCSFGDIEAPIGDKISGDVCQFAQPGNQPLLTLFSTIALFLTGIIVATGVMMVIASGYLYMTAGG